MRASRGDDTGFEDTVRAGYVEVAPTRWEHEGRWLDRPSFGEPDGRIPLTARGRQRGEKNKRPQ